MPVIQRQSTDTAKSITSVDISATDTLTLLIKVPATVTFYRGHRRTRLLPAQDYLPDHHVRRNYFHNYFYVGRRALPGPWLELNLEPMAHSVRHALLHMAPKWSSHRTTRAGLDGGYVAADSTFCVGATATRQQRFECA